MSVEIIRAVPRRDTSSFDAAATCNVCDEPFEFQLEVGNSYGVVLLRLCRKHRYAVRRVLGDETTEWRLSETWELITTEQLERPLDMDAAYIVAESIDGLPEHAQMWHELADRIVDAALGEQR